LAGNLQVSLKSIYQWLEVSSVLPS